MAADPAAWGPGFLPALLGLLAGGLLAGALLAGCVQSEVRRVGGAPTSLPPVDTAQVSVYPAVDSVRCPFTRVAYIRTTGPVWGLPRDQIRRRARQEAGALGANAVVLSGLGRERPGFFSRGGGGRGRSLAVFERRPCE